MQNKPQGLGKGLAALFGDAPTRPGTTADKTSAPKKLPLHRIIPNAKQPRAFFDDEKLLELAESIKVQGVLQPLLVRPVGSDPEQKYEIVAGERRFRASRIAGLHEVPVVIRELTDEQAMLAALIENLQREDLNPMEEAQGLLELSQKFNLRQEDIAAKIGKSRSMVANTLRLMQLPECIRLDIAERKMTPGQARPLLVVDNDEILQELRRRILEEDANARLIESWVAYWKRYGALPEEGGQEKTKSSSSKSRSESKENAFFEKLLKQKLELPVRFSGTMEKGKLSFSFTSSEEFARLMEKLGVSHEELKEEHEQNTDETGSAPLDNADTAHAESLEIAPPPESESIKPNE